MNVDRFLEVLHCVTGHAPKATTPGQWTARCPAHEDKNPSLSIGTGDEGRILLRCFAGCATDAIMAALGLAKKDLFQEKDAGGRQIVALYDYRDAAGGLLYQVVRFAPKDFRQRRPDGAGGWTWNLEGVQRVLYRLPELVESGEKKGGPL